MKTIHIYQVNRSKFIERAIIIIASIVLIYLLISLYFITHFFFNTEINGVNVSLKSQDKVEQIIKSFIKNYELQLIERNAETEEISGQDIGMQYNGRNNISKIHHMQNSMIWIWSLFNDHKYYVTDLYVYNKNNLKDRISQLKCLNRDVIESRNVDFKYSKGSYEVNEEVYGNKIIKDKLNETIKTCILQGKTKLDLDEELCYENPKYTLRSGKTLITQNILNKYVSTKITYLFDSENKIIDGTIINKWLSVDNNLEVVINKTAIMNYIKGLSSKYDTVGAVRNFKASIGKIIEIKGGLYGNKINQEGEAEALSENIELGEVIEKEPLYTQKAVSSDENDIGSTYVEINITRQHLWFYKDGKLIIQGPVVTGNPNRGNSTVVGTYMLNYKQKDATLKGPNYEVKVTYWMPFFGSMGIHDASWRHSFGGEIYKSRGTHGCVNAPFFLAETIFKNIEDGIPIIIYEE